MAFAAGTFTQADGKAVINNILVQEANRIGPDIYRDTLHQSPWVDLIKKGTFQDGMGYTQHSLIYGRSLPVNDGNNTGTFDVLGLNWTAVAGSTASVDLASGALADTSVSRVGPRNHSAQIDFDRRLKSFNLMRAPVESPRLNIDDLRFAAYRTEQIRAIMSILKECTQRSWEERYRDEYDRLCDNVVLCKSAGTAITTGVEGKQSWAATGAASTTSKAGDVDADNNDAIDTITANISNAVMDKIYMRMLRSGAGLNPYGKENGRPVFCAVMSSEASYALLTETGFRDDVRYNNSRVSDLIAPLGVEKAFRGWYHMIDDLAPRYAINTSTDALERVYPEVFSGGVLIDNPAYETATVEAIYVLHPEVMESLIPAPVSGPGVSFDPVNYKGDFKWLNIPDEIINPDGTIGFFRGVLASASKPIQTRFGYVILRLRTSSTAAA